MKKRVLATILAVTMISSLFMTACSSDEKKTDEQQADAQSEEEKDDGSSAEENSSGEKEELTLWMPPFASGELSDEEYWTQVLAPFEEEQNCTVHIEVIPWANYEEKYLTGITSNSGPDVGYMYMEMFYDYIEMGALADYDAYFTEEEKENYLYYDLGYLVNGQYALPFIVGNPRILYANMDILNDAGITEVPSSQEELLAACEAIKESNSDVTPMGANWGMANYAVLNSDFWPYFWGDGGAIVDEDGNFTLDSEAGLSTMEFLNKLCEVAYSDTVTSCDDAGVLFQEGKVAMVMSDTSNMQSFEDINWDYSPVMEGSQCAKTFVACDSLVLLESCENKELAAELMKYMTTGEAMIEFHTELYPNQPPITKDEEYGGDERFATLFSDYTDTFSPTPVFKGAAAIYDTIYKNIQSMMMGELTPQEVLTETTNYYNTNIK